MEPEIVVRYHEIDKPLQREIAAIRLTNGKLIGRLDATSHILDAGEVYYFEAVYAKVFLCTERQVYKTSLRLYDSIPIATVLPCSFIQW